jgi:hypothetical protein
MATNVATADQLSVLFDITVRHVFRLTAAGVLVRWIDEHGVPIKGRYDLVTNVRAYCQYLREAARLDDAEGKAYAQLRNQKMAHEAEMSALKLRLYKRQLHRSQDVEFLMCAMLTAVKSRLLAIPARTTRLLLGKTAFQEIYALLYGEIEQALKELAEYNPADFAEQNEQYLASVDAGLPNGNGNGEHPQDHEEDWNDAQAGTGEV